MCQKFKNDCVHLSRYRDSSSWKRDSLALKVVILQLYIFYSWQAAGLAIKSQACSDNITTLRSGNRYEVYRTFSTTVLLFKIQHKKNDLCYHFLDLLLVPSCIIFTILSENTLKICHVACPLSICWLTDITTFSLLNILLMQQNFKIPNIELALKGY